MTNTPCRLAAVGLAFALVSCASPAKLARQSNEALAKGDLRTAYARALRAVEKDPQNQDARGAYTAVSARVAEDYRSRVVATASADTEQAANLALEYQRFQQEVGRHQTALPPAPDYARAEHAILTSAARAHYQRGVDAMAARRPKEAVDEFTTTRLFDESYADVVSRMETARRAATVRVALLPFVDGIRVPGLSAEIADSVQRELYARAANEFRFTQIVPAGEIERNMTVAELRNPRVEDAAELGRRLGADWVVVGRFRGMRSNDSRRPAKIQIYHSVDRKDAAGAVHTTWVAEDLPIVTRLREVTVQFELDVVDVKTGTVLAHREQSAQAGARVAWTDFRAEEHFDRYALLSPDDRRADPKRAKAADDGWRAEVGSWDLKDFLRRSREQRDRSQYASRYRGEFYADTRQTPVWLAELPSENDMAFVALRNVWRDVHATLKDLDAKD